MIDSMTVGPPAQGFPGVQPREAAKGPRDVESGSFERTLKTQVQERVRDPGPPKRDDDRDIQVAAKPPTVEPPGRKRATTAREQAIQNFMDSFESEFGIPPTKIVEAMALLEPQDLNKAPEQTAEAVVSHLQLSDEDQEKAQAMYASLLQDLRGIEQTQRPAGFAAEERLVASPMIKERFLHAQEKKSALTHSVDQLNQKFWMKDAKASALPAEAQTAGLKNPSALDTSPLMMQMEDAGDVDQLLAQAQMPMAEEAPVMEQPVQPQESMQRLLQDMKQAAYNAKQAAEGQNTTSLKQDEAALMTASAPLMDKSPSAMGTKAPTAEALHPAANQAQEAPAWMNGLNQKQSQQQGDGFMGGQSGEKGESSAKKESGGGGGFKASLTTPTPQPLRMEDVAAALKANPLPVVGAATAATIMTPAEHEANVRQIMNQAQYLIKKGGGEVKVEMTPEGLGQIQMKVLVKDGKVNVQMATETPEAKKAIESSLSDLRSSLAAHKLSVDHVKVDVVAGTNTDSQARNDMNMDQNPQRDGARQFWNQFQENFGNRGAREGFWDMPALKGYRQTKQPAALQPIDASSVQARKAQPEGKGRGLDLVA